MRTPPAAGPAVRVGVALLLCAACFQAGRWYQELSGAAAPRAKGDPGTEMVTATFRGDPKPVPKIVETAAASAVGDPVDNPGEIITPLNVRDPSALVLGPGPRECAPPVEPRAVERPAKPKAVKPLKSGRLLELLKKGEEDKKAPSPKSF